MKRSATTAAAACIAAAFAATATAGTPLTRAQYLGKLRAANALSTRVDDAAGAAAGSRTTTAAQVKAALLAMARAHIAIGKAFSAYTPPAAATRANADFARAELVFGRQNEAIAEKLPATKAGVAKYLRSLKPPSGGSMLDRALKELHAAGFKI